MNGTRKVWRGTHAATVTYPLCPLDDDGQDAKAAVGPGWVLIAVDGAGRVYHFDRREA
jgi:hypothetical protein